MLGHPSCDIAEHLARLAALNSVKLVIHVQVRLTSGSQKDASAHPSCDSPNTSRFASRLAQAINVCLVRKNPMCCVPALWGYEGL